MLREDNESLLCSDADIASDEHETSDWLSETKDSSSQCSLEAQSGTDNEDEQKSIIEIGESDLESNGLTYEEFCKLIEEFSKEYPFKVAKKNHLKEKEKSPRKSLPKFGTDNNNNYNYNNDEYLASANGIQLRCKCPGTKRSTIAGLIEQFEQQVKVDCLDSVLVSDECNNNNNNNNYKQHDNIIKTNRMRDIITRVKYNNSSSSSECEDRDRDRDRKILNSVRYENGNGNNNNNNNEEEEEQEFDDEEQEDDNDCIIYETGCDDATNENSYSNNKSDHDDDDDEELEWVRSENDRNGNRNGTKKTTKSLSERLRLKGVPVLPRTSLKSNTNSDIKTSNKFNNRSRRVRSHRRLVNSNNEEFEPNIKQLTKLRWQPPTDGSQYLEGRFNRGYKKSSNANANCDDDDDDDDQNYKNNKPEAKTKTSFRCPSGVSSTGIAQFGPSIVRYQPSNSRRRLDQLARIRRLKEPKYRMKRPEKAAKVEQIIEQLEKVNAQWEEDEQLLDRAERRDWPEKYYSQYKNTTNDNKRLDSSIEQDKEFLDDINLGCREEMDSLEVAEVYKSHSRLSRSSYIELSRPPTGFSSNSNYRARPSPFADRYADDLAYRRLNRTNVIANGIQKQTNHNPEYPEQSYLLCSAAPFGYSASCSPSSDYLVTQGPCSANSTLERRMIHNDDLYFRQNVKRKPDPPEPPFGIPRQPASASAHSTASHYLRRSDCDQVRQPNNNWNYNVKTENSPVSNRYSSTKIKSGESRVSFHEGTNDNHKLGLIGRESVDSGVAIASNMNESPVARNSNLDMANSHKQSSSVTPIETNSINIGFTDDAADELDLNEELGFYNDEESRSFIYKDEACESPIQETYRAEYMATPIKSRPSIMVENLRSKSPLLTKNTTTPISTMDKIKSQNKDDSPDTPKVMIQSYTDSMKRRRNQSNYGASPATDSLECRLDFDDDEEDDDDEELVRGFVVVDQNLDDSSLNESSIERLNYRASSRASHYDADDEDQQLASITMMRPRKTGPDAPVFSIGAYRSMRKKGLKIL